MRGHGQRAWGSGFLGFPNSFQGGFLLFFVPRVVVCLGIAVRVGPGGEAVLTESLAPHVPRMRGEREKNGGGVSPHHHEGGL